jgi:hypothetical protein
MCCFYRFNHTNFLTTPHFARFRDGRPGSGNGQMAGYDISNQIGEVKAAHGTVGQELVWI